MLEGFIDKKISFRHVSLVVEIKDENSERVNLLLMYFKDYKKRVLPADMPLIMDPSFGNEKEFQRAVNDTLQHLTRQWEEYSKKPKRRLQLIEQKLTGVKNITEFKKYIQDHKIYSDGSLSDYASANLLRIVNLYNSAENIDANLFFQVMAYPFNMSSVFDCVVEKLSEEIEPFTNCQNQMIIQNEQFPEIPPPPSPNVHFQLRKN